MLRTTRSFGRSLVLVALVAVILVIPAAGSSFDLRLVSQTGSTITLGWDQQDDVAAYTFYANGTRVSHTFDGNRTTVTFGKVAGCVVNCYGVEDLRSDGISNYPLAVIPPPPGAKITQTIQNNSTIENIDGWRAVYDVNSDGTEDDPGKITFSVDGTLVLSEEQPPFGDSFADGSVVVPDGQHQFTVRALSDTDVPLATNTVSATVDAPTTPPPPPPPTGFPGANNTGVPAGTVLTPYTGGAVNTPGTVIDGKTIGCITIGAANVVIRNSKISCSGSYYAVQVQSNSASVLVEDSEIDCKSQNANGAGRMNITLRRVDISLCENGLSVAHDVTVEDSYIHDLFMGNQAHADGMQFEQAAVNVRIVHNTIFGMGSNGAFGTSSLIADLTGHTNWLIERNLFGGGAYTIYCVAGKGTNWIIRNNAFTTRFKSTVGYFGVATQCSDETQSGNYILETGQPITLG